MSQSLNITRVDALDRIPTVERHPLGDRQAPICHVANQGMVEPIRAADRGHEAEMGESPQSRDHLRRFPLAQEGGIAHLERLAHHAHPLDQLALGCRQLVKAGSDRCLHRHREAAFHACGLAPAR